MVGREGGGRTKSRATPLVSLQPTNIPRGAWDDEGYQNNFLCVQPSVFSGSLFLFNANKRGSFFAPRWASPGKWESISGHTRKKQNNIYSMEWHPRLLTHKNHTHTLTQLANSLTHPLTHSLTHLLTHQTLTPPLSNPKTQFSLAIGTKTGRCPPQRPTTGLPQGTNKKQFQLQACCIPSHPRAFHPYNVRPLSRQKKPHCLPLPPLFPLPSPLPSPFHYLGIDFNGASTTNLPWPHPIFLPRYASHPIPPHPTIPCRCHPCHRPRGSASPCLPHLALP